MPVLLILAIGIGAVLVWALISILLCRTVAPDLFGGPGDGE
jgi:hypothetical protein